MANYKDNESNIPVIQRSLKSDFKKSPYYKKAELLHLILEKGNTKLGYQFKVTKVYP